MRGRLFTTSVAAIAAVILFGLIYYFSRLLSALVERLYVAGTGIWGTSLLDLGVATPSSDVVANVLFFTIVATLLPLLILFGLIGTLVASTMDGLYQEIGELKAQLSAAVNALNNRLDHIQETNAAEDS
ncbi:MAG: hypothetical protein ACO3NK_07255 [Prochlorotrichaceae cyanobacterium]|jgi:hypothetical protein